MVQHKNKIIMKIYSFDVKSLTRKKEQDYLYNVFEKNIVYNNTIQLYRYFVPREYEMRLDLISKDIYGSNNYIEELMVINNIINPYSIKESQVIYYCTQSEISSLYKKDDMLDGIDENREKIIKASQSNNNTNKIPTTLQPKNIKQVTIDTKNRKIKIMNSFK
jgi:hypothetical protein